MTPAREIYWNIPGHIFLYLLFFPFLIVFLYGMYRQFRRLMMGQPATVLDQMWDRLKGFAEHAVLQRRIARDAISGLLHLSMSWGFVVLFIATCLVALQDYFGIPTLYGNFYLYFMSLTVDLFGIAAIVGVGIALVRRYGARPDRLLKPRVADSYGVLLALFLIILVTGFLIEGLRIAATSDPWGRWSPGGWLSSLPFVGFGESQLATFHRILWWFHAIVAFAFIAYLPYSISLHMLAAPPISC
jgi:nitrate reductase gamma subunit